MISVFKDFLIFLKHLASDYTLLKYDNIYTATCQALPRNKSMTRARPPVFLLDFVLYMRHFDHGHYKRKSVHSCQ